MAKKQYTLIVDTETTITDKVVDFGAVVVDKKGNIMTQCAVLLAELFIDRDNHPLFHNELSGELWKKVNLDNRYAAYQNMVKQGTRTLASVAAVNRWLEKVAATYNPYLTAYNLAFDRGKCENTGIDLTLFPKQFCLWAASADRWVDTKAYKNFVMSVHAFNPVTKKGNATYKANAETMARFVLGQPELVDEPHTALEDVIYYELPIFVKLAKGRKLDSFIGLSAPSWQHMQMRDHFTAK